MNQQSQTLGYFSAHTDDWQSKATQQDYSVIENRHAAVLAVLEGHQKINRFLDIGCGTGQLTLEVAKRGVVATGLDFAPEMIAKCEANRAAAGVDASFQCGSFFDIPLSEASFDVISAQGFIEYISLEQLDIFFATVAKALTARGSLALGTRNRLFNLHSLNSFTELEMALSTTDGLLKESLVIQNSRTQDEALAKLAELECIYPQPEVHPITGIKVDTRYQFSPADLMARMRKHGLKAQALYPVHFHGLPLSVISEPDMRPLHRQLARLVSNDKIADFRYVAYSSSFVIKASK